MGRRFGVYTIGYEDLTIDQFVRKLREHEIKTVVDVRLNAISRRKGFSKSKLTEALNAVGIDYIHERDLGNPPENRESFRNGESEVGRRTMRARLDNGSRGAVERLVERAKNERVALLCVEATDDRCHRQVVVEVALEVESDLYTTSIW